MPEKETPPDDDRDKMARAITSVLLEVAHHGDLIPYSKLQQRATETCPQEPTLEFSDLWIHLDEISEAWLPKIRAPLAAVAIGAAKGKPSGGYYDFVRACMPEGDDNWELHLQRVHEWAGRQSLGTLLRELG